MIIVLECFGVARLLFGLKECFWKSRTSSFEWVAGKLFWISLESILDFECDLRSMYAEDLEFICLKFSVKYSLAFF